MSVNVPAATGSFLLLHGWQNQRPAGHWQHWLAGELRSAGHQVRYPQLPDPDHPRLTHWLSALDRELAAMAPEPAGGRTVLCHSLGCLLWMHAVARDGGIATPVDRVLLVAPPSPSVLDRHPEISGFAPPSLAERQLAKAAHATRLVCSDDDPYAPEGAAALFGEPLGIPVDLLAGQGHLDMDAGYGMWPTLLSWCLDPGRSIRPRTA
ncbi:RBBP9/YdeN family alpha/beta hydrolase [Streptomyces sp. NPDC006879]|uniref:RBBP9/YdeN family alpha/beta hydrolase n=1 Tax=Streptomyces sp. NPDC006879 TaxID=3364767 RepID=UPI00368066FC